jgi:hypothetical protein
VRQVNHLVEAATVMMRAPKSRGSSGVLRGESR